METKFIDVCANRLKREIKSYPREQRALALDAFERGFERSLHSNYPERFHKNPEEVKDNSVYGLYALGLEIGNQFGVLEAEIARQEILEHVDRVRQRLTTPSVPQRFSNAIDDFYTTFAKTGVQI